MPTKAAYAFEQKNSFNVPAGDAMRIITADVCRGGVNPNNFDFVRYANQSAENFLSALKYLTGGYFDSHEGHSLEPGPHIRAQIKKAESDLAADPTYRRPPTAAELWSEGQRRRAPVAAKK